MKRDTHTSGGTVTTHLTDDICTNDKFVAFQENALSAEPLCWHKNQTLIKVSINLEDYSLLFLSPTLIYNNQLLFS